MSKPAEPTEQTPDTRSQTEKFIEIRRKLQTFVGMPRRCRERACRRAKRCVGPTLRCTLDFPGPKLTDEEDRQMRAEWKRSIEQDLARRAALRGR